MAHMMKHTKASCGHMFAHFDRKAEHISNENLDRTRTHLNYNLADHQQMDQGEFVRQRCSEVRCQNRKDINVMCSWVVTAPKDLPANEHRAFFENTFDFLEKRYGKENTVSAHVHMDEVTPHLHYAFVPVVHDVKHDRDKVSAKERVSRTDLQTFHKDLSGYLEKALGHEVNVLNEATKEGNKSIEVLKRESAINKVAELEKQVNVLQADYNAKSAYIKSFDEILNEMYPKGVSALKKGIFDKEEYLKVPKVLWEAKHISSAEKEIARNSTQEYEKKAKEVIDGSKSEKELKWLKFENKDLKDDNAKLTEEVKLWKGAFEKAKTINEKVLKTLPNEVENKYRQTFKKFEKEFEKYEKMSNIEKAIYNEGQKHKGYKRSMELER